MAKYIIEVPELLELWDYEKNEPLNLFPEFLKEKSNVKYGGSVIKDTLRF